MASQHPLTAALFALCLVPIITLVFVFNYNLANGASFVCRFEMSAESTALDNQMHYRESRPKASSNEGQVQSISSILSPNLTSMRTITTHPTPSPSERPTALPSNHPTSLPSERPTPGPTSERHSSYFGLQPGFDPVRLRVFTQEACYAHLREVVFVHIPKTGGEAVEQLLGINKNHRYASDRKQRDTCWDSKFKFTVVRNPWDRMLSFYFHLRKSLDKTNRYYRHAMNPRPAWKLANSLSFNDWIAKVLLQEPKAGENGVGINLLASAHEYLFSKGDKMLVDFVVKFENLERDIKRMLEMIGKPRLKLPNVNASKRKRDYRSYYNKTSIAIVAKVFARDVSTFNYTY